MFLGPTRRFHYIIDGGSRNKAYQPIEQSVLLLFFHALRGCLLFFDKTLSLFFCLFRNMVLFLFFLFDDKAFVIEINAILQEDLMIFS